jgi:hypothetical protein
MFEKALSRFEANLNTSLNSDVSLSGTYALNEYVKPMFALNLHTNNSAYNIAPSAGIMFIAADERFAPYVNIHAGPNFSLAKKISPGFFLGGAVGFQYALTNKTGFNIEVLYKRLKYPSEYFFDNEAIENLGIGFGLNYRFGGEEKKSRFKQDEKSFFDKISLNVSASINAPGSDERGASYMGYNVFGLYDLSQNLKFGAGFEYNKINAGKNYSAYFAGMMQTSSKKFPIYARLSAGLNFSENKSLSPGLMLSFAAGMKYNISDKISVFSEVAMKNLNNQRASIILGHSVIGFSIGISIRLGK